MNAPKEIDKYMKKLNKHFLMNRISRIISMSRLTSLFRQIPNAVRPFLRYDHRPLLTLACLDVSIWRFPEPETVSIRYYDTISYPEHIAILDDNIIVAGYEGKARSHFTIEPCIYGDFHLPVDNYIRDLKTVQNNLLVFPHTSYLYLGDKTIDLQCNTGKSICVTPTGFVVVISTGTMREYEHITGVLLFYEKGVYTHSVNTPHLWKCVTWVGNGDIAFAATRMIKGCAEVFLLSIHGDIIRKLYMSLYQHMHMGFSILYDPVWEEYLLSGDKQIIALSEHNNTVINRVVYEYDQTENSYYFHALTWQTSEAGRFLLFCIRNHSLLGQIEIK